MNRAIVSDVARRKRWAAAATQRCFLCGRGAAGWGYWLEIAHIFGGAARCDTEPNLTLQHRACHSSSHGITVVVNGVSPPPYTLANVLWGKRRHDAAHYDVARLAELAALRGVVLPEPEEPK